MRFLPIQKQHLYVLLFLLMPCLFFWTCNQEDDLQELDFFTVILDTPTSTFNNVIGSITLKGRLGNDDTYDNPSSLEQGFFWALSLDELDNAPNKVEVPLNDSEDPKAFSYQLHDVDPEATYYIKAYVKGVNPVSGKTREVTSSTKAFTYAISLSIDEEVRVENSTAIINARIDGLDAGGYQIEEYGFLFSQNGNLSFDENGNVTSDVVVLLQNEIATNDRTIRDTLDNLAFNTDYYYKAWAKSGERFFYSEETLVPIKDGWVQINNFPITLRCAVSAAEDNFAYIAFGDEDKTFYPRTLYQFDIQSETWNLITDELGDFYGKCAATAQLHNDALYVGYGHFHPDGSMLNGIFEFSRTDGSLMNEYDNFEEIFIRRKSLVSFKVNNKLYFGTGYNKPTNSYLNDFIEFDPVTKIAKPIKSLPIMVNGVEKDEGRDKAVAFVIDNVAYVGLGTSPNEEELTDFWRFIPPIDDTDLGNWEFHSSFPGTARNGAVATTIADKAYVGTGENAFFGRFNDWWEFDPFANPYWQERTSLPALVRTDASVFSIGNNAYLGLGQARYFDENDNEIKTPILKDFWKYIPEN